MDEAARRWVSPFCMLSEPDAPAGEVPELYQFQVWVLHPGPEGVGDAAVVVRLYNSITGALAGSDTKTLKPRTAAQFNPGLSPLAGWRSRAASPSCPGG